MSIKIPHKNMEHLGIKHSTPQDMQETYQRKGVSKSSSACTFNDEVDVMSHQGDADGKSKCVKEHKRRTEADRLQAGECCHCCILFGVLLNFMVYHL